MSNDSSDPTLTHALARLGEAMRIAKSLCGMSIDVEASQHENLQWLPQVVSMSAENLLHELNAIADIIHLVREQERVAIGTGILKQMMERMQLSGTEVTATAAGDFRAITPGSRDLQLL